MDSDSYPGTTRQRLQIKITAVAAFAIADCQSPAPDPQAELAIELELGMRRLNHAPESAEFPELPWNPNSLHDSMQLRIESIGLLIKREHRNSEGCNRRLWGLS